MAADSELPDAMLALLQGVWFPTHVSEGGRLIATFEPMLPAPKEPHLWLLTVVGDTVHFTANADYYASGGRLRARPESGRLTFECRELPPEFDTQFAYQLDADELLMQSGGFPWSGQYDSVAAFRYVRVAASPTPEMAALIESVMRYWARLPPRAEPHAAPDPAASLDSGSWPSVRVSGCDPGRAGELICSAAEGFRVVQTQEEDLAAVFRRTGRAVARGIVTGVEFTNRVFDEFASLDRVYPAVIPALWDLVPVGIREGFAAAVHRAVTPGFRYHAFYIGGGRPMTDEELRRDADLRTARVRAWALEFVRFLAGVEA